MLGIDYSSSDDEDKGSDERPTTQSIDAKVDVKPMANPFDSSLYELTSSESDEDIITESNALPHAIPHAVSGETTRESFIGRTGISQTVADRDQSVVTVSSSSVSIFSNPFKEEETKRLEQLERHVKMSDNNVVTSSGDSKSSQRICWTYHKHKKCKFGNRCRFKHVDNDFIDPKSVPKTDTTVSKKRVGITDSLIPPKRALNHYYSQQKH